MDLKRVIPGTDPEQEDTLIIINDQLSMVNYQLLSIIKYQLSIIINYQLPIINYQLLSIINYQLLILPICDK